jgi:hypothetical protein
MLNPLELDFIPSKKAGGQKRKRVANYDASDIEGYTGKLVFSKST